MSGLLDGMNNKGTLSGHYLYLGGQTLILFLSISSHVLLTIVADPSNAQVTTAITPTTGVGNLGTTVTPNGNVYNINGGTRPGNGPNLFHSFGLFSVGSGDIANFNNTSGLFTQNILSRVTGGQPSNIFGTLQTTGFGNANLFLMNPAGIVFGPTATLNVGGAVNFTTADYLRLADQSGGNAGIFHANPSFTSVLTSAPVVAFGFLTSSPAPITVQGSTLTVSPGQTLSFVGGNVTFAADPVSGATPIIQAPGGQVQIASVASPGEVLTPSLNFGPNVNGQSFTTLGTTTLSGGATLDVSGDGAGSISIRGGQLVMDAAQLIASTVGDTDGTSPAINIAMQGGATLSNGSSIVTTTSGRGKSGDVLITASNVQIDGSSIRSDTLGPGNGGNLSLTVGSLSLTGGAQVSASTEGTGAGGRITISAMNGVTISGFDSSMNFSGVMTTSSSSGPGGDITVITPNLSLDNGGIISTTTLADGQGGNILLNVGTLNVTGGAQITSNTGTFDPDTGEPIGSGNGGDITVTATNSVLVSGGNLDIFALSNISSNTFASGSGGTIRIIAPNVTLAGAGSITSSSLGDGAGGNVSIIASNLLSASGFSDDFGMATSIVSSASGSGAGGAIVISAPAAKVDDRAAILTSTFGSGSAGDLTLQVGSLSVTGGASITTTGELGSSGKLTITAQDNVSISGQFDSQTPSLLSNDVSSPGGFGGTNNGITISAGTFALTNGGRIESRTVVSGNEQVSISARDTIMVSGSKIQAFTSGGEVSPLQFSAPTITLNQATITSSTASNQNAGAINFTAGNVNLSGGSSIRSDTQQGSGQGGSIVVTASDSILLSQGSTIQSNTTTLLGGSAGSVTVNAGNLVSLSGSGSTITSTTSGSGGGGSIQVQAGSLQLSDGALISAASTGTGNAGTVNIQTGGNFVMNGGIVSTSATQATGGNITVNAGQQVQMNSGALISASSSGPGNAGDIAVSAGDSILLNASTIKTEATQADGGNITLTAPNTIHLTNSTVSSSVGGGVTTVGGNITIDPQFLILQNSQIIAQAFEGQGGNINITAGVFLADPNSVVSASSQKGINGSVVIQSPIANLSQIIAPLQKSTLQATAFLLERCAVRAQSGTLSSLTVRARDVAPAAPGGMLSGPLLSLGPSPGASGASRPAVQESVVPKPPLLEVSGELFRRMDGRLEGQLVGCGS